MQRKSQGLIVYTIYSYNYKCYQCYRNMLHSAMHDLDSGRPHLHSSMKYFLVFQSLILFWLPTFSRKLWLFCSSCLVWLLSESLWCRPWLTHHVSQQFHETLCNIQQCLQWSIIESFRGNEYQSFGGNEYQSFWHLGNPWFPRTFITKCMQGKLRVQQWPTGVFNSF